VAVDLSLDWRQLGVAALLCVGTTLLFGLWPALRASRIEIDTVLKGGRAAGLSLRNRLTGGAMVSAQVALSLALLLTAALFLATLRNLAAVNTGFERANILIAQMSNPGAAKQEQRRALWNEVHRRVSSIHGVESAAFSTWPLFTRNMMGQRVTIQGREERSQRSPLFLKVSPGYFATMGTRLLSGRAFEARDVDPGSGAVAVVNESFVRGVFNGESPLGKRFAVDDRNPEWIEIAGVVEDIKYNDLRTEPPPMAYFAMREFDERVTLQVRTRMDLGTLAPALRREIASAGPVRVERVTSQTRLIDDTLVRERLLASVSGLFAGLALVLSAIGLFGVMTYSVTRRTREIGLRMAVGARQGDVVRMVLKQSLTRVLVGVVAGLALALPAARLLAGLLFGLQPTDPLVIAVVVLILVGVAGFASYIPARRAARIDPLTALRYE
jgi:predicted permease